MFPLTFSEESGRKEKSGHYDREHAPGWQDLLVLCDHIASSWQNGRAGGIP